MTMRVASAPTQAISAERAAGFVTSGMWLDYGTSLCQPDVFDKALGARIQEVTHVKIRHCLTMRPRAVLDADPEGQHVHGFSLHYSGYDRKQHDCGRCNYIPVNLGEIPDYYRRFIDPVDIVILKTCPIDENGYFNLSAANLWHRAIVERARMVIVETTRGLPYFYGDRRAIAVRARRLCVERRQIVHLPFLDLRQARRASQQDRAESDARQCRDHTPLRRHVRRDRVRGGQSEGKIGCRTRQGADRHRASGLSRGARTSGVRAPSDPARPFALKACS